MVQNHFEVSDRTNIMHVKNHMSTSMFIVAVNSNLILISQEIEVVSKVVILLVPGFLHRVNKNDWKKI